MMDFDKELDEILNKPFDEDCLSRNPVQFYEQIQCRLDALQRFDPIIKGCIDQRNYLISRGEYRIQREHLYAAIAFHMLKAKRQYEKLALEFVNSRPEPAIILKREQ